VSKKFEAAVLPVDKPAGITSREVVDQVRDYYGGLKAGHGGTLDRLATGVLPVFLGRATPLINYFQKRPKTYRVKIRFDLVSETLDLDGNTRAVDTGLTTKDEFQEILYKFSGKISQRPPRYSALKIGGRRASDLARAGEKVELNSREVEVCDLRLTDFSFPSVSLELTCKQGFYVRALARDLGHELGTEGGVVAELIRVKYGSYNREDCVRLENKESWNSSVCLPASAVDHFPVLKVTSEQLRRVSHGGQIVRKSSPDQNYALVLNDKKQLVAVMLADLRNGESVWQPERVLAPEQCNL